MPHKQTDVQRITMNSR